MSDNDLPETPDTADDDTDAPEPPEIDGMDPDELKRKTAEAHQAEQEKHNEMLQAVANGEEAEIEGYEWVEFDQGVEAKMRTWLSSDALDCIEVIGEHAEEKRVAGMGDVLQAHIQLLIEQTEVMRGFEETWNTEAKIAKFYRDLADKYGVQGLENPAEKAMEAADLEEERRADAAQSFRADKKSPRDRKPSEWRS